MKKIKPKAVATKSNVAVKQVKKLTAVSIPLGKMKIKSNVSEYKSKKYLDIRVYYQPKDAPDTWAPTQKGVSIPLAQASLFLAKLNKLDKALDFSQFAEESETD